MSIINNNVETVDSSVQAIKDINTSLIRSMELAVRQGYRLVWNNTSFTPQQILDGFGKDAATLFQASSDIQSLIMKYDPSFTPVIPTIPFTINADGTVTVTTP